MRRISARLRNMRGRQAQRPQIAANERARHRPLAAQAGKMRRIARRRARAAATPAATRTAKKNGFSHSRLQGNSLRASSSRLRSISSSRAAEPFPERRAAVVPHHGLGRVDALPAGDARAQAQLGIVAIGEKILVETADLVQHLACGTGPRSRPATALPLRGRTGRGPSAPLPRPRFWPSGKIRWPALSMRRGSSHTSILLAAIPTSGRPEQARAERGQPARFGLGVVVQQGDELAARGGDALVVGGAEPAVFRIADHARREFPFRHLRRAVGGAVVHHDGFKLHARPAAPATPGRRAAAPSGSSSPPQRRSTDYAIRSIS